MKTIRISLDEELLRAVDGAAHGAARRMGSSRSAMVRDALQEHLRRLDVIEKEEREREGYRRQPQSLEEVRLWEGKAVWPQV